MPSFAGARAKLATATQDLFRLSGTNSIPVEASASSEPPPPPAEPSAPPTSSGRKPEQSIMFSLEALMKANSPSANEGSSGGVEEVSDQLWNMQAATPLFGTAHDQALLTTPLKIEPAPSMDSMTLPSHAPNGRRWLPVVLAACGGLALAGAGIWAFAWKGAAPVSAASPAAPATLAAPASEPAAAAPAPAEPPPAQEAAPSAAAAPAEPAVAEPSGAAGAPATAEAAPNEAPAAAAVPAKEAHPKEREKPSSKRPPPRAAPAVAKAAFDKGAAKSALAAAASQAASCGAGGAPGKGKIQVTFATSGKVSDAQLVEGPFGGTTAGKCALRHFKAAKVPAFAGAPVTVAKSFKVD